MTARTESTPGSVLWVVDLSREPQKAFYGIERFKKAGSEIHILYVGDDVGHHPSWYGNFEPGHAENIHERTLERAEKRLNHICDKYLSGCPFYIRHSTVGDPREKVRELISREDFDLIVIPSRLENRLEGVEKGGRALQEATTIPVLQKDLQENNQ